jgi:hypothetical protein
MLARWDLSPCPSTHNVFTWCACSYSHTRSSALSIRFGLTSRAPSLACSLCRDRTARFPCTRLDHRYRKSVSEEGGMDASRTWTSLQRAFQQEVWVGTGPDASNQGGNHLGSTSQRMGNSRECKRVHQLSSSPSIKRIRVASPRDSNPRHPAFQAGCRTTECLLQQ